MSSDCPDSDCCKAFQAANDQYAAGYAGGKLPLPPARKVAILTCMDARLHPNVFLGLNLGDAHVIRNAGGRATDDVLRSLAISQRLLGTTELHIIHHTDCGMLTFNNDQLRHKIKADLDVEVPAGTDFLPFTDLHQSMKDDVHIIRTSPIVTPGTPVFGHIYDVHTGRLTRIC